MYNLILVRHAKSSWDKFGLADVDRPLNKRGLRDAPFMAEVLKQKNIQPDLIISSHAVRAFSTAKYFAEILNYSLTNIQIESELYHADIEEFLSVLRKVDDLKKTVMIFSHNPGLLYFLHYLTETKIDDVPTCGIFSLNLKVNSWKKLGEKTSVIDFYEYPKKYFE